MPEKVIIIGSGPGGYTAASRLSSLGYEVTIVEKKNIGGTCLNVGCIPTKVLLDHLSTFEEVKELIEKKKILKGENVQVDSDNLIAYQSQVIAHLSKGLEKLFKHKKIEIIIGEAKFISNQEIEVSAGQEKKILKADHFIIATGSKPRAVPTFEVDKKIILTSDEIWNIPIIPKKLLVIGSGPIGIEFARVYNNLGTEVTIAEIKENICPILDVEISENLERSLKRRKIKIRKNSASKLESKKENSITVKFLSTEEAEKNQEEEFDIVLVAVGRKPNTDNLALENAGVELEPGGFIRTDRRLKTSVSNIWAVGDVTNFPQLAHTASYQGRLVAENISGGKKEFEDKIIPSCIYGYPEVSFVGYSEEQLIENKIKYKKGKALFLASGKAKASGHTEGLVKVLVDELTEEILGAHIVGPQASSLIHELVVAMKNKLTVEDVISTVHAHPTYSEVILEALEESIGEAIHS